MTWNSPHLYKRWDTQPKTKAFKFHISKILFKSCLHPQPTFIMRWGYFLTSRSSLHWGHSFKSCTCPQGIIPHETMPDSWRVPFCEKFKLLKGLDYNDCDFKTQSSLIMLGKINMTSILITKSFVLKDEQVILKSVFTSLGQARGPPLSPEHADWSSIPPHTYLNIMTIFFGQ